MGGVLMGVGLVGALAAFGQLVVGLWHRTQDGRLDRVDASLPSDPPRITEVLPARNEGHALEAGLADRLRDHWPALDICVVDDRSTDDTGAIADRLAELDDRVRVLHLTERPQGWLGKVHAQHQGVASSDSPWVLLSDADVLVAPSALTRAMNHARREELDVVAVVPTLRSAGPVVDSMTTVFARMLLLGADRQAIRGPGSPAGATSGAFTLVRREALERAGGVGAARTEVADDLALGKALKASGATCDLLNGRGLVQVLLYPSTRDFFVGAEKNAYGVAGRHSAVLTAVAGLVFGVFELAPLLLVLTPWAWLAWAAYGSHTLLHAVANQWNGRPLWSAALWPLGSALSAAVFLRAAIVCGLRGGLAWRETVYKAEDLAMPLPQAEESSSERQEASVAARARSGERDGA